LRWPLASPGRNREWAYRCRAILWLSLPLPEISFPANQRRFFLVFNRLPKNRVPAAVLLLHGPGRFFEIVEHLRLDCGGMGDDRFRLRIHFEHRAAAGAGYIE